PAIVPNERRRPASGRLHSSPLAPNAHQKADFFSDSWGCRKESARASRQSRAEASYLSEGKTEGGNDMVPIRNGRRSRGNPAQALGRAALALVLGALVLPTAGGASAQATGGRTPPSPQSAVARSKAGRCRPRKEAGREARRCRL